MIKNDRVIYSIRKMDQQSLKDFLFKALYMVASSEGRCNNPCPKHNFTPDQYVFECLHDINMDYQLKLYIDDYHAGCITQDGYHYIAQTLMCIIPMYHMLDNEEEHELVYDFINKYDSKYCTVLPH